MELKLGEVKNELDGEGASEKAARSILEILNGS
jgi:hypothetical protein